MFTSAVITTALIFGAHLVQAAPANPNANPVSGLGFAGQDAVAEAFKLGDAVLNVPGDAVGKAMSGDVMGAATGAVADAMKLATDLPADAGKMVGDLAGKV